MTVSLAHADRIAAGALAEARARDARPMAVMVLDAGGHPVVFRREDRASLFRFDIARAKAMGALGLGADTREIAERARSNPAFFTSLAVLTGGQLALSAGGLLIRDARGEVVGAVGVSGDTAELDEACAAAGVSTANFSGQE